MRTLTFALFFLLSSFVGAVARDAPRPAHSFGASGVRPPSARAFVNTAALKK